ncbi:N-alpha-acetyltransferase 60 [Galendromus occidentalis]|uniref:N-alpha-acetyltransferase 60 n=1 Tax=Galendromus occidentalis TaxID=34638 RepID=A0AAJ6VWL6_9ACAR|nr:N-alpha-acetyltransferase 60 [Galendromus occidentalis]
MSSNMNSSYCQAQVVDLMQVQLRFLTISDVATVKVHCLDWFPIEYPDSWYLDITTDNGKYFSLAAVHLGQIIGVVVAQTKGLESCREEDQEILSAKFPLDSRVTYILVLGVCREYRRSGVASLLINSLLEYLRNEPVQNVTQRSRAVFLHVLSDNMAAISFYSRRGFVLHSYLPQYYEVRGVARDGYCYVRYINDGHAPYSGLDKIYHWLAYRAALLAGILCHLPILILKRWRKIARRMLT